RRTRLPGIHLRPRHRPAQPDHHPTRQRHTQHSHRHHLHLQPVRLHHQDRRHPARQRHRHPMLPPGPPPTPHRSVDPCIRRLHVPAGHRRSRRTRPVLAELHLRTRRQPADPHRPHHHRRRHDQLHLRPHPTTLPRRHQRRRDRCLHVRRRRKHAH